MVVSCCLSYSPDVGRITASADTLYELILKHGDSVAINNPGVAVPNGAQSWTDLITPKRSSTMKLA